MREKIHFYFTDTKSKVSRYIDIVIYTIIGIDIIDHGLMTMESMQEYTKYFASWDNVPLVIFSIE